MLYSMSNGNSTESLRVGALSHSGIASPRVRPPDGPEVLLLVRKRQTSGGRTGLVDPGRLRQARGRLQGGQAKGRPDALPLGSDSESPLFTE